MVCERGRESLNDHQRFKEKGLKRKKNCEKRAVTSGPGKAQEGGGVVVGLVVGGGGVVGAGKKTSNFREAHRISEMSVGHNRRKV